jgi:transposase
MLRGRCRGRRRSQGALSNYKVLPDLLHIRDEPGDHGIGRSRVGLTTKTHAIDDGTGLPLVIGCTPGQSNDSPALPKLLVELRVWTGLPGRPRTTPDALLGDKAYSARAHRTELHRRGIKVVIPEPSDQADHRKRKGSRGGRAVGYDVLAYRNRNVVERCFNTLKNWRGLATRYDK